MVFSKDRDGLKGFGKGPAPAGGLVGGGGGAVDGYLNQVATPGSGQKRSHFLGDQGPIAQDAETQPISNEAFNDLRQIGTAEGFPSFQDDVHDRTAVQFLKKLKPFFGGQIMVHLGGTGEMGTIRAAKIAAVGNREF